MAEYNNGSDRRKLPFTANVMIFLICAVLLVVAFRALLSDVNKQIVNANIETVKELVLHDKNNIRNSVDVRWDTMEGAEKRMAARQWTSLEELMDAENMLLDNIPDADRTGLLDSEGTLYSSTGLVRKDSFYQQICEGRNERFVIRLNTEAHITEAEKEVLIEAVPVSYSVCGKEMKWMICQFPVSALESSLKIGSYGDEGFSSVIDAEGNYILNISATHSFGELDNLFDELKDAAFEGYRSINEVRAAAAAAETAVIYTLNGQKYLMIISSFDFADWYIISVVPMSVFSAQSNAIIFRFIILLGIIIVILAVVLYLVYRQRKEREKLEREKHLKEAEERKKLIDGITASYNVAYTVNMADDSFRQLRMDSNMIGHDESFSHFTQAKDFFIQLLLPVDRERMRKLLDYAAIRKKLAGSKSFNVEYRLPVNGAMIWHTMNVTAIDEDLITIGFVVNDLGITKKHLEDKRFSEYFALYEVDFDTEMAKIVIDSPYYPVNRSGTAVPYREAMMAFADSLEGEAKAFFARISDISIVKKAFENEDKYSYTYRSSNLAGGRWVDLTSFVTLRHEDGTPAMFTLGFSYIDSFGAAKQELQEKLQVAYAKEQESNRIIGALSRDYTGINYVELTEDADLDIGVSYRTSDLLKKLVPGADDMGFTAKLRALRDNAVYEPDREQFYRDTRRAVILEALSTADSYTVYPRLFIDGEIEYYELKFSAIREDGKLTAVVAGLRSINAEKKKELKAKRQIEEALSAAESASRAKTEFLFNMTHDVRTPMNAIIGFTNIAEKHIDDREKVLDCLGKMKQSGSLLLSLINGVLDMSRIEHGSAEIVENAGDVLLSFASIEETLREEAEKKDISLKFEFGEVTDRYVYADFSRCLRIFTNLITNSIKYTKEGGYIRVRCEQVSPKENGYANYRYTVKDNGIGMSEDFQARMFESFTREYNSTMSGIQGTGLGLSVCKTFVDYLGGTIACESKPGKGTVFTVTLPFRVQEGTVYTDPVTGELVDSALSEAENTKKAEFNNRRVLLVEDNAFNREIAQEVLEEEGLVVETAEDGSIAVDLMSKKGPDYYDFILMDIQMPVMNGYEATKAIRKMYPDAAFPIIALSANAFEEDKQKSLEAGMNAHVAKPINIKELYGTLAEFI